MTAVLVSRSSVVHIENDQQIEERNDGWQAGTNVEDAAIYNVNVVEVKKPSFLQYQLLRVPNITSFVYFHFCITCRLRFSAI